MFGHEIQCLMHAFGEVRYCARDVLVLVEDAVRDVVLRVALEAREGDEYPVSNLSRCLQPNPHAIARLNLALRATTVPRQATAKRSTDIILDLSGESERPSELHAYPSWRAGHAFRSAMAAAQFSEFLACKTLNMVRHESRSSYAKIRGTPRIILFKEWLGLPNLSDQALHVLGHVAWEAIGILTQTALMGRYWHDLSAGFADPRSSQWTYGRHLLAGLAYGLASGIMVQVTDFQVAELKTEIDAYVVVTAGGGGKWRGYEHASSPCLLPTHINEALRRLTGRKDCVFGWRGDEFGLGMGGVL